MKEHRLKTEPSVFAAVLRGDKLAEYRLNDRDYQEGDDLVLCDFVRIGLFDGKFLGSSVRVRVTHVVKGPDFGMAEGYAMLSIRRVKEDPPRFGDKVRHKDAESNDYGFLDWGVVTRVDRTMATVAFWDGEAMDIPICDLVHCDGREDIDEPEGLH